MPEYDAVIVGAGLAGLTCALRLQQEGWKVKLFEKTDRVGGRVRTEMQDGFTLDHGFQVLLTAYPECRELLDFKALQLGNFAPGAAIRWRGKVHTLHDPWRNPGKLLPTALSPIGTFKDKLRLKQYRQDVMGAKLRDLYFRENKPALAVLEEMGFSRRMIEPFFRPFFSGIFLEPNLETSRRVMDFVFKMFSEGDAALPAKGMAAIAEQLAAKLQPGVLELKAEIFEVEPGRVELAHGTSVKAGGVAIAVPFSSVGLLVKGMVFGKRPWLGTTCAYYAAPRSPLAEKMLFLNADGDGVINNLAVPSDAQPAYAPAGQSLVVISTVGCKPWKQIREKAEAELKEWFPADFPQWKLLKVFEIERALPRQNKVDMEPVERLEALEPGFYMCGDHRQTSSIQGAMASGWRTAEALIKERRLTAS